MTDLMDALGMTDEDIFEDEACDRCDLPWDVQIVSGDDEGARYCWEHAGFTPTVDLEDVDL